MPHYELDMYEALVREHITRAKQKDITEADYRLLLDAINAVNDATKSRMRRKILPSGEFFVYVQQHQRAVVSIQDMLFDEAGPLSGSLLCDDETTCLKTNAFKAIYKSLEDLQLFFEDMFRGYIDPERKVAEAKRLMQLQSARLLSEKIKKKLNDAGVDERLCEIATGPLVRLPQSRELTLAQLRYLQLLADSLMAADSQEELIRALRRLNFNSHDLFLYITDDWTKKWAEISSLEEQLYWLQEQQSINELSEMLPGMVLIKDYLPLRDQLTAWLQIKEAYISDRIVLQTAASVLQEKEHVKMVTDMPVAELVYFKRLELEVSKIEKPNLTRFFDHISDSYSTPRQKDISKKNIRTCYYNVMSAAQNNVDDRLHKMLKISKGL